MDAALVCSNLPAAEWNENQGMQLRISSANIVRRARVPVPPHIQDNCSPISALNVRHHVQSICSNRLKNQCAVCHTAVPMTLAGLCRTLGEGL
eukprot:SAG11_NODE_2855_length_2904_cov_2.521925_3_plen_93_part_00